MQKPITFLNKSNEKLSGILHVPKKYNEGVILSHCFTCSKHHTIMRRLARKLCQSGFLALRFDFSGNGESEGKFELSTYSKQMNDLKSAITYMKKRVKKIHLIGHSKGASISILAGTDKRVTSICVLSPQSDTKNIKTVFSKATLNQVEKFGKASFTIFGREFILTKAALKDATKHNLISCTSHLSKPFYIIHGEKDMLISCTHAKKLYKAAKHPKRLDIIKDSDHFFTKKLDEVLLLVIQWLNNLSKG